MPTSNSPENVSLIGSKNIKNDKKEIAVSPMNHHDTEKTVIRNRSNNRTPNQGTSSNL